MKEDVRKEMLAKRKSLSVDDVRRRSLLICAHLEKTEVFQQANSVLFYLPIQNEVDARTLIEKFIDHKTILLPYVDEAIHTSPITSLTDVQPGKHGVLEPTTRQPSPPIDLIIAPGVAFDSKGGRLGYGKGYYDQFLAGTSAFKVGLAYSEQLVDEIPTEQHDIPMDIIITEAGVL